MPIEPIIVATPFVRSMVQRSVVPPTLSAAYPDPDVTEAARLGHPHVARDVEAALRGEVERGPPSVIATGFVCVPLLGGFWT